MKGIFVKTKITRSVCEGLNFSIYPNLLVNSSPKWASFFSEISSGGNL